MESKFSITITAFPDKTAAKAAAKLLVEQRLAACVQIMTVESIYAWDGKVCDGNEVLLFVKSKASLFEEISALIKNNHSYNIPEIVQIPLTDGLPEYLKWIEGYVK